MPDSRFYTKPGAATILGLLMLGCSTSPIPVLEPWPFKEDRVTISCELGYVGMTMIPAENRVFVAGSDGLRYAANDAARAVVPYMSPLLAVPDDGQVVRVGLRLCDMNAGPMTFRPRALIEMS
jgi:hypothetical protein